MSSASLTPLLTSKVSQLKIIFISNLFCAQTARVTANQCLGGATDLGVASPVTKDKLKELGESLSFLNELKTNITAEIAELTKKLQSTDLSAKERYALLWDRATTQVKLDYVDRHLNKTNAELNRIVCLLLYGVDNIVANISAQLEVITNGLATELTILITQILGGNTNGYQQLIAEGTAAVDQVQALCGEVFARLSIAYYAEMNQTDPASDNVRVVITLGLGKIVSLLTQLKITQVTVVAQLTTALDTAPKPTGAAEVALEALRTASQAKLDTETAQLNCIINYVLNNAQDQADIVNIGLVGEFNVLVIELKNGTPGAHESVQPLIDAGVNAINNVQAELKFIISNLNDSFQSAKKIGGQALSQAKAAASAGYAKAVKILSAFRDTFVNVFAKLSNLLADTTLPESVRADYINLQVATQGLDATVKSQLSTALSLQASLNLLCRNGRRC